MRKISNYLNMYFSEARNYFQYLQNNFSKPQIISSSYKLFIQVNNSPNHKFIQVVNNFHSRKLFHILTIIILALIRFYFHQLLEFKTKSQIIFQSYKYFPKHKYFPKLQIIPKVVNYSQCYEWLYLYVNFYFHKILEIKILFTMVS